MYAAKPSGGGAAHRHRPPRLTLQPTPGTLGTREAPRGIPCNVEHGHALHTRAIGPAAFGCNPADVLGGALDSDGFAVDTGPGEVTGGRMHHRRPATQQSGRQYGKRHPERFRTAARPGRSWHSPCVSGLSEGGQCMTVAVDQNVTDGFVRSPLILAKSRV